MRKKIGVWITLGLGVCLLAGCGPQSEPNAQPSPQAQTSEAPEPGVPAGLGLPDKFAPTMSMYPIVASKSQKIAHRRDCGQLQAVASSDREYFRVFGMAQNEGYKPCPKCRPDRP